MHTSLSRPYRAALAGVIMQTPALRPVSVQLGNGAETAGNGTKGPASALYAPLPGVYAVTPVLSADGATITAHVSIAPGSEQLLYNEAALLTQDGTVIMHGTCTTQQVASGVQTFLTFALNGALVVDATTDDGAVDFLAAYMRELQA